MNKEQKKLFKIKQGHVRELKKEHGALDGRFRTRSVKDKSVYDRNVKHKNRFDY
jgi:hypothetical protein